MIGCPNAPADSTISWRRWRFTYKSLEEHIVDLGMDMCSSLTHQKGIRTSQKLPDLRTSEVMVARTQAPNGNQFPHGLGACLIFIFSFSLIALLVMPRWPCTGTSLDSVVFPDQIDRWTKLCDNQPLAQLHIKFWGKSMAEEEEAWCARQHSTSNLSNSENDDIQPGCYVLNIDNDAIKMQSIWVRVSEFRLGKISSTCLIAS